jgi:hypothetical protein
MVIYTSKGPDSGEINQANLLKTTKPLETMRGIQLCIHITEKEEKVFEALQEDDNPLTQSTESSTPHSPKYTSE